MKAELADGNRARPELKRPIADGAEFIEWDEELTNPDAQIIPRCVVKIGIIKRRLFVPLSPLMNKRGEVQLKAVGERSADEMSAEAETKIRDAQAMSELAGIGFRFGPRLKLIAQRDARAEVQRDGLSTIDGDAAAELRVNLQFVFLILIFLFLFWRALLSFG